MTTNKKLQMACGIGYYTEIGRDDGEHFKRFTKRQHRRAVRRNKDFLDELVTDVSPGAADFLLPAVKG